MNEVSPFFLQNRLNKLVDVKETEKKIKEREPLELEKGDVLALVLAALKVFLPILIGFIVVIFGLYWLFTV